MASDIPEKVKNHLKALGLTRDSACWEVRSGTWAVKHFALERIAAQMGIKFDEPQVLTVSPEYVALCVTGHVDGMSEWSVGEASAATSNNKYYCAMAEKRAKDRVILKLIGVHGEVYAEDEADDFTEQGKARNELKEKVSELMAHNETVRNDWQTVSYMKAAFVEKDALAFAEAWLELSDGEKEALWLAPSKGGVFTTEERAYLRSNEVNAARKEIING
jgi:hypothetical protein